MLYNNERNKLRNCFKGDLLTINMDPSQPILPIILIIILVILSAFFSSCETAYTSANKIRLKTLADDGNKKASKVLAFLDKYDRFISTVLIGNNIVNILSTSLSTVLFVNLVIQQGWGDDGLGTTLATIIMTVVILIFGEFIPKGLAKNFPESFAMFYYPFIRFLSYVFLPFSVILESIQKLFMKFIHKRAENETITEDELLTIIDEIEEENMIKPYEKNLISNAIKFDDIEVKDLVTPRNKITGIEVNDPVSKIHAVFKDSRYSRLPVYKETLDNIIGILNEKDFYQAIMDNPKEFKIQEIMQPVHFFHDDAKISIVFHQFKESKFHMGIVLDSFEGTLGIITLEDILEELVGEIYDESDEIIEETREMQEGEYVTSGKESILDAFEVMEIEPEEEMENQSVNSWVSEKLKKIPTSGDNFLFDDEWKVTVLSANKKGATSVRFEKL